MQRFIDNDPHPGPCAAGPLSPGNDLMWTGRRWAVTNLGMQMLGGAVHIPIARLLDRDDVTGRFKWPEFIASKWPGHDPADFMTAWLAALALHQPIETTDYARQKPPQPSHVQAAIDHALVWLDAKDAQP